MASPSKVTALLRVAATSVLVIVLLSCSSDDEPESIGYPQEADTLILSYRWTPGSTLAGSKSYWVYGDRRAIAVWMDPDEPAWSAVETRVAALRENQMQYFLSEMKHIGMLRLGAIDFGAPQKFRVGPVTLYIDAGGSRRQVTYESTHEDAPDLTQEQNEKRSVVRNRFAFELGSASTLPDKPYEPASTALLVKSVSGENGRDVREWPLEGLDHAEPWDGNEVVGNRCLIVPSEEAEKITTAMEESEDGVVWRSGGELYQVRPHPLLPHEKDCATVQPYFWP